MIEIARSHIGLKGTDVVCDHCGSREGVLPCEIAKLKRRIAPFVKVHRKCAPPPTVAAMAARADRVIADLQQWLRDVDHASLRFPGFQSRSEVKQVRAALGVALSLKAQLADRLRRGGGL